MRAAATATRTCYASASARGRLTPTARARAARDRCRQSVCTLLVAGIVLLLTTTTKSPPSPPPPPPPEHAPPPPPPLQLRTTSTPPTDLASFVRAFADYDFIHIPKTGGTSVDAVVAANASIYNLVTKKLGRPLRPTTWTERRLTACGTTKVIHASTTATGPYAAKRSSRDSSSAVPHAPAWAIARTLREDAPRGAV